MKNKFMPGAPGINNKMTIRNHNHNVIDFQSI
jgi:hypothetical protein